MWPLWLVEMSLQHIQKNSPRLLPKPAKFETLQSYKENKMLSRRNQRSLKVSPYTNKRPLRDA